MKTYNCSPENQEIARLKNQIANLKVACAATVACLVFEIIVFVTHYIHHLAQ